MRAIVKLFQERENEYRRGNVILYGANHVTAEVLNLLSLHHFMHKRVHDCRRNRALSTFGKFCQRHRADFSYGTNDPPIPGYQNYFVRVLCCETQQTPFNPEELLYPEDFLEIYPNCPVARRVAVLNARRLRQEYAHDVRRIVQDVYDQDPL